VKPQALVHRRFEWTGDHPQTAGAPASAPLVVPGDERVAQPVSVFVEVVDTYEDLGQSLA
jgi:hypothetical protein